MLRRNIRPCLAYGCLSPPPVTPSQSSGPHLHGTRRINLRALGRHPKTSPFAVVGLRTGGFEICGWRQRTTGSKGGAGHCTGQTQARLDVASVVVRAVQLPLRDWKAGLSRFTNQFDKRMPCVTLAPNSPPLTFLFCMP